MRWDLDKQNYKHVLKRTTCHIYMGVCRCGGANVPKVFVGGNQSTSEKCKTCGYGLREACVSKSELFLRALNADFELLERSYLPNVDSYRILKRLTKSALSKKLRPILMRHHQECFNCLVECRLGVYTALQVLL